LQVAVSGLLLGGLYSLIAVGLTLVFGVVRIINFAHGELLMVAMYLTWVLHHYAGMDPYLSVLIVAPVLFLTGMLVQRVFIQPILGSPASMKIFVTVGLSIALQNLALMIFRGDFRTIQTAYSTTVLNVGGLSLSLPRLIAFGVALLLATGFFLFLKYTFTGKALRALAEDREAAALMGIPVKRLFLLAFGLGTGLVGVAGAMLMPIFYAFPTVGHLFGLTAFVVVVLGGMGSMQGAMVGGLIIGVVESFSGVYIAPALKEAVYFSLFILVLLVRPQGLFGLGRGTEEVGLK
jgi:branched-chain amino acid transport system permease protein